MTLTRIIPSLRRSIPDPLSRDRWPEFTEVSTTDVSIAGVSLLGLVDLCGTPCVHTAAAVIPGSGGRPSKTELASVVVAQVVALERRKDGGVDAWLDAELDGCRPIVSEARMIGRASTAHVVCTTLRPNPCGGKAGTEADLPSDLRIGDLIVVPCIGVEALRDVRPH
ncbi:MAG: hypothetical protein QOH55_176 [Microbacteriaceae bacterium]|jgi:hypothetical protein|nr:hypothetical protein [Microbacteriaceae bacterium]